MNKDNTQSFQHSYGVRDVENTVPQIQGRHEVTAEELKRMSEMDFADIGMDEIAAFGETAGLKEKTPEKVLRHFKEKGYNPYFRKEHADGGCVVKISFANNGVRMADAVAAMLTGG